MTVVVLWILITLGVIDVLGRIIYVIDQSQRPHLSERTQRANDLVALFINATVVYFLWGILGG